jgi:hypothetical protein
MMPISQLYREPIRPSGSPPFSKRGDVYTQVPDCLKLCLELPHAVGFSLQAGSLMEHRSFRGRLPSSFSAKNPRLWRGFFALEQEVLQMVPVKKNDADEERLAALEEMGIEEKALVYDEAGAKLLVSDDSAAIKDFYARAFQEWALGNIEGTAEEIFDAVALLVGDD